MSTEKFQKINTLDKYYLEINTFQRYLSSLCPFCRKSTITVFHEYKRFNLYCRPRLHIIIQGMSFGQDKLKGHHYHHHHLLREHHTLQLDLLNVLIKCCNTKHLITFCTLTIYSTLRSMNQLYKMSQ